MELLLIGSQPFHLTGAFAKSAFIPSFAKRSISHESDMGFD